MGAQSPSTQPASNFLRSVSHPLQGQKSQETNAKIDRSPLEQLQEDGHAYLGWSHVWKDSLRSIILAIAGYQGNLLCQTHDRTRSFAWAEDPRNEHGGLAMSPTQADFPLVLTLQKPATAAPQDGLWGSAARAEGRFGSGLPPAPEGAGQTPPLERQEDFGMGAEPFQSRANAGQHGASGLPPTAMSAPG